MRLIRDVKWYITRPEGPQPCKHRYSFGSFFLPFEDLIKKDPSSLFSQSLHDLLTCLMNAMCHRPIAPIEVKPKLKDSGGLRIIQNPTAVDVEVVSIEDIEAHQDEQATILFRLLIRCFGKQFVRGLIEDEIKVHYHETGQDLVHLAIYGGLYGLVFDVLIDELEYDVDFYRPPRRRLTLLHTVAKYRMPQYDA